jgi:hypothetical protein
VVAVVAAVASVETPVVEAKFTVSLAVQPAQPTVRQAVRMTLRTEIVLPRKQEMSLVAIGPWRKQSGQGVLYARLVRTGPRAFTARLRFPYAGRWRIELVTRPGSASLPPFSRAVTVLRDN